MVVIELSKSAPKLRGDLTKWLFEISPTTYIGFVNPRVRDRLWDRVKASVGKGSAIMAYTTHTEQRIAFKTYGWKWEVADFDGLCLMRRPFKKSETGKPETTTADIIPLSSVASASNQSVNEEDSSLILNEKVTIDEKGSIAENKAENKPAKTEETVGSSERRQSKKHRLKNGQKTSGIDEIGLALNDYIVLDTETTGLDPEKDLLLEVGALKIRGGVIIDQFSSIIFINEPLSDIIKQITGLNDTNIEQKGKSETTVISVLLDFIEKDPVIGHNVSFDLDFLKHACKRCGLEFPDIQYVDTLGLARKTVKGLKSYKLQKLADYFGIQTAEKHRALPDCFITQSVYSKLKEIDQNH